MPASIPIPLSSRHTLAAGLLASLLSPLAQSADIRVITDTQHPIQNPGNAQVIELDRASRIEAELAANLPRDPARAAATVQQRLTKGDSALQQRISEAYQGVADAWSLGITTLPAVVVDQRYVVYGEPDVAKAVARIDAHRRAEP